MHGRIQQSVRPVACRLYPAERTALTRFREHAPLPTSRACPASAGRRRVCGWRWSRPPYSVHDGEVHTKGA